VRAVADPTSPPASRLRQPKWTDARLVAGVLMVLVAVVAGAAVVSAADKSVRVWAVRRSLKAGTALERGDVTPRRVRLYGADLGRYVDVIAGEPTGRVLLHDLVEGELLPRAALGDGNAAPASRHIAIPLSKAHALGGEVERGDVVDVIATRKTSGGGTATYAVLRAVPVLDVTKPAGGFGAGQNDFVVTVRVDPDQALAVAAAIQGAELDLSLVVAGPDGAGDVGGATLVTGPTPSPAK
jgi:Flp pilus assembly protein CpaB